MHQKWIEKAKSIARFHKLRRAIDDKWTLEETANLLHISIGAACEAVKIVSWLRTHEKDLERLSSRAEALNFIRRKQREIDIRDLES